MFGNSQKKEIEEKDPYNIFTPGVYHGLDEIPYRHLLYQCELEKVIPIVQERAKNDGEWCIRMDLVGHNGDKMRRMIAYCSDPENIKAAFEYALGEKDRNIDFLCRDLANASKSIS